MSRLFPHSAYAEDQPYAHSLLWSHILYRGFQTGTTLGMIYIGGRHTYKTLRKSVKPQLFSSASLATTGRWALATTVLMVPATIGQMWGKEEIEWQDRSWRLLENEGQMEVDDWSLIGTVAGAAAGLRTPAVTRSIWRLAGGAGVGSMVGVGGYMVWRHGIHRGKWPEKER